ncbi:hypothetical protein [Paenibacillus sp. FSL H3-0333]|uniref:hypothetical protein n=1 Tax=Paenibacillus sp. FSL H3-0333 TaxID=2921373 RepID=UPI0030F5C068
MYREIAEESGIEQQELRLVKHLKTYLYYAEHKQQRHERHVYWLEFVHEPLPAWERSPQ